MNRRVAYPFLTLSDSAVLATPWQVSLDGQHWTEPDDYLSNWDPSCTIRLRRTICIEPEVAAHDLALARDQMRLGMGIRVGTGQGRLPRRIIERHRQMLEAEVWEWTFEYGLSGQMLSVVLDLFTEVTLAVSPSISTALAPQAAGDRIWSDRSRLRIEGEEPRFPIEATDLTTLLGTTIAAGAPWHLHWSPLDWDRDFHGAVRLYLNERTVPFLERIEGEDVPTIQALLADVMGQICERFVLDPEVAEMMANAEPGSLGAQAVTWLRKAWPGKDAGFIKSVLESRPGVFRSAFLALAEPGEA